MGKHRSQFEWQHLIQKYYAQDIPLEQFYGMNNLNPKTFCQHKRAYRKLLEEQEEHPPAFVLAKRDEIDEEDNTAFPPENHHTLMLCAGELQLSLPASTSPQWFGVLLKEALK